MEDKKEQVVYKPRIYINSAKEEPKVEEEKGVMSLSKAIPAIIKKASFHDGESIRIRVDSRCLQRIT